MGVVRRQGLAADRQRLLMALLGRRILPQLGLHVPRLFRLWRCGVVRAGPCGDPACSRLAWPPRSPATRPAPSPGCSDSGRCRGGPEAGPCGGWPAPPRGSASPPAYSRRSSCTSPRLFRLWRYRGGPEAGPCGGWPAPPHALLGRRVLPQFVLHDPQVVQTLGDIGVVRRQGLAADGQCLLMALLGRRIVPQLLHCTFPRLFRLQAIWGWSGGRALRQMRQRLLVAPPAPPAYSRNSYCTSPRLFRLLAISGWSGGRALRKMASACSWLCLAAAYSRNSALHQPQVVQTGGDVGVVRRAGPCGGCASACSWLCLAAVYSRNGLHVPQVVQAVGDIGVVRGQGLTEDGQRLLVALLRRRILPQLRCTFPRLFRLWAISGWSGGRALRRIASACS